MTNLNLRDIIIQQNLYHINMANSAVRVIVKVKRILMKVIIYIRINVSIIILLVIKKLQLNLDIVNPQYNEF